MTIEFALSAASALLAALAALAAICCFFACRAELRKHGTTSLRVELDELQDSFVTHSKLLKRINQRGVMAERRADGAEPADDSAQAPGESSAAWKARMRAKLIVPGRPVQHR